MTEEEWAETLAYLHEMERRYGKDTIFGYGVKGPRPVLYFVEDGRGKVPKPGEVMGYFHYGVRLRVENPKGGEEKIERNFPYAQLRTQKYYEGCLKKLRAEGKTYTLTCKVCGGKFESKTKDRATCCSQCTKILKRKGGQKSGTRGTGITVSPSAPMTEEERQRVCPACGMTFRAKRRWQVCCSTSCSSKWRRKKAAGRKEAMEVKDILGGCKL